MEAVRAQVTALTDELTALRGEIVQIKSAHAKLHQDSVEANSIHNRSYADQADRIVKMEKHIEDIAKSPYVGSGSDNKFKSLIEPKQVEVPVCSGALTDDRSKFLSWAERVKDRVMLYEGDMVTAMAAAEKRGEPITADESLVLGVGPHASKQLNGFLKR